MLRKSRVFIALVVGFLGGVILAYYFRWYGPWLHIVMAFCFAGNLFAWHWVANNWKRAIVVYVLIVIFGISGGLLRSGVVFGETSSFVKDYGTKVDFEGVVISEPDVRTDRQLVTVRPDGKEQNVLITTVKTVWLEYGDRVWVRGKLLEPESFNGFNYPEYLQRYNTYALVRFPKIITLEKGEGNWLYAGILQVKQELLQHIERLYPPTSAQLLEGILLGVDKALPPATADNFRAAGLSHIVAVSGFNISVLVHAFTWLPFIIGRRKSLYAVAGIVICFAIMTGMSASVIRAAIMGILVLVANNTGRLYASGAALCAAAGIMVALNPWILVADIGFQLSFAATLGIVYIMPLLEQWTKPVPVWKWLKQHVLVTIAAMVATLPLVFWHFNQASLIALPANILTVPLIGAVMLFGVVSFVPVVGPGAAFINHWLCSYILVVAHWSAEVPHAVVATTPLVSKVAAGLASLVLLCMVVLYIRKRPQYVPEEIV